MTELNEYMTCLVEKARPVLNEEMLEDARLASDLGVSSDDDFKLFHYIDHFSEDLAQEIIGAPLEAEQENSLKRFLFSLKEQLDFGNLVSFRAAVLKWMQSQRLGKEAYPNHHGGLFHLKRPDLSRWASLAHHTKKLIAYGKTETEALLESASYLQPPERPEFMAWYRFKFGRERGIYDLNDDIARESEGTMSVRKVKKQALFDEGKTNYYLPEFAAPWQEKEPVNSGDMVLQKEKQEMFQQARARLVSRTFAIDKLLEKYRDLLTDKQIGEIEDALNALRKKVRLLNLTASIRDSIIKTSNIFRGQGFGIGAAFLKTMADELDGSAEEHIEKVAGLDLKELQGLLNSLYDLSTYLKRRDVVRQLASVDLKLHDMMLSSFFPEIGEAQSKLIDATGYASNKIEDVMAKIRATVTNPKKEGPPQIGDPVPGEEGKSAPRPQAPTPSAVKAPVEKPTAPEPEAQSAEPETPSMSNFKREVNRE